MKYWKLTLAILVGLLSFGSMGCVVRTRAAVVGQPAVVEQPIIEDESPGVVATSAPPIDQMEIPSPAPSAGYVWIRGHWRWTGRQWLWIRGRWVVQRVGYQWTPGYWDRRAHGWIWIGGRWVLR